MQLNKVVIYAFYAIFDVFCCSFDQNIAWNIHFWRILVFLHLIFQPLVPKARNNQNLILVVVQLVEFDA